MCWLISRTAVAVLMKVFDYIVHRGLIFLDILDVSFLRVNRNEREGADR